MTRRKLLLLTACTSLAMIVTPCLAQQRTWTSHVGTTLEARAVRVTSDEKAVLLTSSGKELLVPFWQLSDRDRNYLSLKFGVKIEDRFRTWTDQGGTKTIHAQLVRVEGDVVVLQRKNGKEYSVPLAKLSAEDQHFAKQQRTTSDSAGRQRYLKPVPAVEVLIDMGLRGWSDGPSTDSLARCAVTMKQMDIEQCVRGLNYYRYETVWQENDASKRQRVGNALLYLAEFGPVHFEGWDVADARLAKEVLDKSRDDVERSIALMNLASVYRLETMNFGWSDGQEGKDSTDDARKLVPIQRSLLESGNTEVESAALRAVVFLNELARPNRDIILSVAERHEDVQVDDLEKCLSKPFVAED